MANAIQAPKPPKSRRGKPYFLPAPLRLLRPVNALIAGAGVLVGAACMPGPYAWPAALWGFAAMAALAAGGNAENDVVDLPVDKLNRPDRPLPSGELSIKTALALAYGLYAAGIVLAAQVSAPHALLAGLMVILLIDYNRRLKRLPLWGNLAVSWLCAAALLFPEWPSLPRSTGLAAGFAFATTWLREMLKDVEDMPGDRAQGLRTAPLVWGERAVLRLSLALAVLLVLALPLPYLWGYWPKAYAAVALVSTVPLLLGVGLRLAGPKPSAAVLQRRMKWVMLSGLAAILAGALVQG